ncbi:ABC transporter substrate-binding protein [Klebsiella variicola]|uniref:ABC transporter substrate-binding protein n=1 Tax=Klebsiella variicola TaxID=244366 RepID=UPI002B059B28|nr:ABC transporter substrate-binding protein [Klebsiella variicola]
MLKVLHVLYTLLLALCLYPVLVHAAMDEPIRHHRIIITGNCPFGVILANPLAYRQVVGVGPWAFLHADMNVLKDMKPDIGRITTHFINEDYSVNLETLLSLHPDLIFYYGQSQNDHLERAGVPVINLDTGGSAKYDPEATQSYWETSFEDALGLPRTDKFHRAWETTRKAIQPYADRIRQQHIRALYLEQSDGKTLRVSGPHTFGDTYLKMTGMENVAGNLQVSGDAGLYITVSMEQIMAWNPDVIFVVFGSARALPITTIPDRYGRGYAPGKTSGSTQRRWDYTTGGGLSAESPLLPLFMVSKLEPDVVSDADMKHLTRAYYQTMFNYAIPDRLLNEVLSQR